MPRIFDTQYLHPLARIAADSFQSELMVAGIPLRIYETVRSPFRQAELYAVGRAPGTGERTKTKARAWDSLHQYGFAWDMVFLINGRWTWDEPEKGMWDEYTARAKARGLIPLSFERPHVQLPMSLAGLHAGNMPPYTGNDLDPWADWLEEQAEQWGRDPFTVSGIEHPGAPLWVLRFDRPDIGDVA